MSGSSWVARDARGRVDPSRNGDGRERSVHRTVGQVEQGAICLLGPRQAVLHRRLCPGGPPGPHTRGPGEQRAQLCPLLHQVPRARIDRDRLRGHHGPLVVIVALHATPHLALAGDVRRVHARTPYVQLEVAVEAHRHRAAEVVRNLLVDALVVCHEAVEALGLDRRLREAAVPDHPGVDVEAGPRELQLAVQCQPVLVPEEPDHRLPGRQDLLQLIRRAEVGVLPVAEGLVMRQ
mmetsp:Transcript_130950/g.364948  ORF Transcript_130950/g.364948 Transcript_130950/m.364948 type:complete len:235 (+) Transcript_130950:195-899(+)